MSKNIPTLTLQVDCITAMEKAAREFSELHQYEKHRIVVEGDCSRQHNCIKFINQCACTYCDGSLHSYFSYNLYAYDRNFASKVLNFRIRKIVGGYSISYSPVQKQTKIASFKSNKKFIRSATIHIASNAPLENPNTNVKSKCRLNVGRMITVNLDMDERRIFYRGEDVTSEYINVEEMFKNLRQVETK